MPFIGNFVAGLLLVLSVCVGGLARADQTDPRLDRLFADLKTAETADAAQSLEANIWEIWGQANDEKVNHLMASGAVSLGAGDYGRALSVYDQVIVLAPKFAEGWNKRATTLYLMSRYADSERDIAHVLALEPRHFGALSGLGMCNLQLHRTKEALEALQSAQSIDPMLSNIRRNIEQLKQQLARESI